MSYNNFINKDLRKRPQSEGKQARLAYGWIALGLLLLIVGIFLAFSDSDDNDSSPSEETTQHNTPEIKPPSNETNSIKLKLPQKTQHTNDKPALPIEKPQSSLQPDPKDEEVDQSEIAQTTQPSPMLIDESKWQTLIVKKGESLSVIFEHAKIKPVQLHLLMKQPLAAKTLKRIHPKDTIKVVRGENGELIALNYQIDEIKYLQVERHNNKFKAKIFNHEIEIRHAHASTTINSSLFLASANVGLSQNTTMELANVFGWDIDFALDIRKGDKFTVIYEQRFKDGDRIKDGNILAAEFINQGKTYRAVRYTEPGTKRAGYFSPDGHSMRKAFLRSPVKFSRISSRFTVKRYHPILHRFRSHKGVDYAAGRGTPVRASGDGKIIHKGRKGGYGRTVIIKHGSRYTTLYAHLNSYNRKSRAGRSVKQGQIIGYVGSSGLASGPHLHYEFRINGVHRNPLTVKFPNTKPIPKRYRENFKAKTQQYLAQLDTLSRNSTLAYKDN